MIPSTTGRRLGMAVYGDITHDSRVQRTASSLAAAGWEVTLYCLDAPPDLPLRRNVEVRVVRPASTAVQPRSANPYRTEESGRLRQLARRARWLAGYVTTVRAWGRLVATDAPQFLAWHLHDLPALAAIAPRLSRDVPVVYDAHELFLESGTAARVAGPARRALAWYERRRIRHAAAVVTVNGAVAAELDRRYAPPRMLVVRNCPPRQLVAVVPSGRLRLDLTIPDGTAIILYHGSIGPLRGVEQLISAMEDPLLREAHLVLLGFGEGVSAYADRARNSPAGERIHFLPAVSPEELLPWVAAADVGAMPIQASTLNHRLSTPNKLWECLAAGVPVVASDFPAVREVVLAEPGSPLGVVCDPGDPSAIAEGVASILGLDAGARATLRERCRMAAVERWNWEAEVAGLVALYDDLVPS